MTTDLLSRGRCGGGSGDDTSLSSRHINSKFIGFSTYQRQSVDLYRRLPVIFFFGCLYFLFFSLFLTCL